MYDWALHVQVLFMIEYIAEASLQTQTPLLEIAFAVFGHVTHAPLDKIV